MAAVAATDATQRPRRVVSALLALALAASLAPAGARAQGDDSNVDREDDTPSSDGSWSGQVELRANYYWERSTRVVAPGVDAMVTAPNGVRVTGDYLVDSITSASQAAGVIEDIRFTEIRHQGGLGAGYEFDLGETQLDLSLSTSVSKEPDYLSLGGGINGALSLNDRNSVVRLGLYYLHDEIRQQFRSGSQTTPMQDGSTSADAFEESFDAFAAVVGWDQVWSPQLITELTYQYGYLNGFLANAYRRVGIDDNSVFLAENHPGQRNRHTLTARLAYYHPVSRTSLNIFLRGYADDWSVFAITPEVRIYQEITRYAYLRLRYRFYSQSQSDFYEDTYRSDENVLDEVTADPKMSEFRSHMLGLQLVLGLDFLEGTALEPVADWSLDFSFDHLWNENRFGNGVIAQAGIIAKF